MFMLLFSIQWKWMVTRDFKLQKTKKEHHNQTKHQKKKYKAKVRKEKSAVNRSRRSLFACWDNRAFEVLLAGSVPLSGASSASSWRNAPGSIQLKLYWQHLWHVVDYCRNNLDSSFRLWKQHHVAVIMKVYGTRHCTERTVLNRIR